MAKRKKASQRVGVDRDGAEAEAEVEAEDAKRSLDLCRKVDVTTQAQLDWAVKACAEVKVARERVDDKRRSFVDPLRAVVDDLNAFFKPALESLSETEAILKSRIMGFVESRRAERARLLASVEDADPANAEAIVRDAEALAIEKPPGLSLRESWDGVVEDRDAIVEWAVSSGRLDVLVPDVKALKALTKARDGALSVPGWKPIPKSVVAINAARA